jgi:hypothetical protein
MADNAIPKSIEYTGKWTVGTAQGLMIVGPPLLLLAASTGLMLLLTRNLITMFGKGGLD